MICAFAATSGAIYGAILIIDPFDIVVFSPPLKRAPVTTNQRFSFPALARKAKFDSVIIGTSMSRLLRPARLNKLFGAHFVNLSMNSPTVFEMHEIYRLFVRHHPAPKVVLFGIDGTWCETRKHKKLTFRPFPPWLFDENPWNDLLYLYNPKTVEQMGLQFAFITGIHQGPRRGLDGYTNFLPPQAQYNLARARRHIYSGPTPKPILAVKPAVPIDPRLRFPSHERMKAMLDELPPQTLKLLVFMPYHVYVQPRPGSRQDAQYRLCKARFAKMARGRANAHILDFMIPSALTREDRNYWDSLHYNVASASRIVEAIKFGVAHRRSIPDLFNYIPAALK